MKRIRRTTLLLVAWCSLCRHLSAQRTAIIDDKLLEQLLQQAPDAETAKRAKLKDPDAIFDIARLAKNKELSNRVLHILADYQEQPHAMSQIALAFHYYKNHEDKHTALKYLMEASDGQDYRTNQLALHNAGQIASELGLWVTALTYSRRAASFQPVVDQKVAAASKKQWEDISKQISTQEVLSIELVSELFLLAHMDGFPEPESQAAKLWTTAIEATRRFNQTFVGSAGRTIDLEALETAATNFRATWESSKADVSRLQLHLLLKQLNFVLGYLSGFKESYLPMAAANAEVLARTPYCYGLFDPKGDESSCFNNAASLAVNYYRLANDMDGAKRAMEMGASHPDALTHWKVIGQTPRVFHASLTSNPHWDAKDFQLASALQSAYSKQRDKILSDLDSLKTLFTRPAGVDTLEIDPVGEVVKPTTNSSVSRRTISALGYIIRMGDDLAPGESGGALETIDLFDGFEWNQAAFQAMPTLCRSLQKHERRLCSGIASDANTVQLHCGSETVVRIVRIRPGNRILPRTGETNNHLTLCMCLGGCDGLEVSVDGTIITDAAIGAGQSIIFDDSL